MSPGLSRATGVHTPASHRQAPSPPSLSRLVPTTWPPLLIASGRNVSQPPPGTPRSVIIPSSQRTACHSADPATLIWLEPTTWPASLIADAVLLDPPGSVPRSMIMNSEGGDDGGAVNCTVRAGGLADSLDS